VVGCRNCCNDGDRANAQNGCAHDDCVQDLVVNNEGKGNKGNNGKLTSGSAVTTGSTATSSTVIAGVAMAVVVLVAALAFVVKRKIASRGVPPTAANADLDPVEMIVVANPVFDAKM
jgi:hypothetical protein